MTHTHTRTRTPKHTNTYLVLYLRCRLTTARTYDGDVIDKFCDWSIYFVIIQVHWTMTIDLMYQNYYSCVWFL